MKARHTLLSNLIELHELGVSNYLEDVNFTRDALDVSHVSDFVLLEDFDGNLKGQHAFATLPFRL